MSDYPTSAANRQINFPEIFPAFGFAMWRRKYAGQKGIRRTKSARVPNFLADRRPGKYRFQNKGLARGLMERYVRFIVRHRVAVVVATVVVTVLLGAQLPHLRMEIRQQALIPQNHPFIQTQNRIVDLFGGETTVIVGVVPRHGDIFNAATLAKIARITHAVEQLPDIVKDNVFSIAAERVKLIRGTAEGMDVHPLMASVPHDPADLAQLRRDVLGDKLYRGTVVGSDGRGAAIIADFKGNLSDTEIVAEVEKAIAPERDAVADVVIGGAPMIRASVGQYTRMMAILFPVAVLIIGLVHYEAFRTLQAMFLPLLTALLSVIWALGIMAVARQPMDTWSAITPVVILAVAAGHALQILKRYYEEYARLGNGPEAVVRSVTAVGPVMLTAGAIAAAGFGSLITFGISSVRVFGLLLATGILSALFIEMTFTPACRALLASPRGREAARESEGRILRMALEWIATTTMQRPRTVLLLAAAVVVACIGGALSIRVDNSFKEWFPAHSPLRQADTLLNERLAGTATLSLLVEGDKEGAIQDPRVLRAISDLENFLERRAGIGGALSVTDYLKRMNRAMHGDDPAAGVIPDNRQLIAQYFLLYSFAGPNDLAAVVDPSFRFTVVRAFAKTDDAAFGRALFQDVGRFVQHRFAGLPAHVRLAGGALGVQTAMNEVIVREKILNVAQVGIIIFFLSALALRSLSGGLIVLIPLAIAVAVNLGIMGWFATPLSIATAAITAMAVSIGADFAIYLLFRIREELRVSGDLQQALRQSLLTSGKAIFFVSSAVAVGYLILPFSGFGAWVYLGTLTGLMVSVSALATLTVLPALITLTEPQMLWRHAKGQAPYRRGFRSGASKHCRYTVDPGNAVDPTLPTS